MLIMIMLKIMPSVTPFYVKVSPFALCFYVNSQPTSFRQEGDICLFQTTQKCFFPSAESSRDRLALTITWPSWVLAFFGS